MSKLFTVAGTSVLEGILKFRVANGSAAARTKVLVKSGHTDINLQDLPHAMSKEDAMTFLNYTQGKPVAPKAAKPKAVAKEFKVANKAPAKSSKTPEEIAAVKAKNLQTMREVTARQTGQSVFRKQMHEDVRAEFELIEAEMDKFSAHDIPAFFRKECGFED